MRGQAYSKPRRQERLRRNAERAAEVDPTPPPAEEGEQWRAVDGWEGRYQISSRARVWSVPRTDTIGRVVSGRIIRQQTHVKGRYHQVVFWRDGNPAFKTVHKLVAEAFLGPCPPGMEVCHGPRRNADGSYCDWPDNLEYGTRADNAGDRWRDGTLRRGETAFNAILSDADAAQIRQLHSVGISSKHRKHRIGCGHWTYDRLAAKFGVTHAAIGKVIRGQTFGHLSSAEAGKALASASLPGAGEGSCATSGDLREQVARLEEQVRQLVAERQR
jgi:hypothetical protein